MKLNYTVSGLILLLLAFIAGGAWTKYLIYPIPQISEIVRNAKIRLLISEKYELSQTTNVESPYKFISIANKKTSANKRYILSNYIYRDIKTKNTNAVSIISDCRCGNADVNSYKSVDRYFIKISEGFVSNILLYKTKRRSKGLFIVQGGHGVFPEDLGGADVIERMLNSGFDVGAISLPMSGRNSNILYASTEIAGRVELRDHSGFDVLESNKFSPIVMFVAPIVALIDTYRDHSPQSVIGITGISGGGWTTVLAAAIDSRISCSYPVAGNVPRYLIKTLVKPDWGDYEQNHGGLLSIASELDWYIMAVDEPWRRQIQFFNKYDPCCFMGETSGHYRSAVRGVAKQIDGGYFYTMVDSNSFRHQWSKPMISAISDDMQLCKAEAGIRTTPPAKALREVGA
jgi:hypothetical protein